MKFFQNLIFSLCFIFSLSSFGVAPSAESVLTNSTESSSIKAFSQTNICSTLNQRLETQSIDLLVKIVEKYLDIENSTSESDQVLTTQRSTTIETPKKLKLILNKYLNKVFIIKNENSDVIATTESFKKVFSELPSENLDALLSQWDENFVSKINTRITNSDSEINTPSLNNHLDTLNLKSLEIDGIETGITEKLNSFEVYLSNLENPGEGWRSGPSLVNKNYKTCVDEFDTKIDLYEQTLKDFKSQISDINEALNYIYKSISNTFIVSTVYEISIPLGEINFLSTLIKNSCSQNTLVETN